ncbi:MAG: hypothetical protein CVV27_17700 [Candidatus Melainabacteria bacterium HGW-Melainabacteria-1]|nr:MAG: hypothetical protein CVV27_17700 [Candidatus Melainabacteria bacterium HGW-Melainabacteria-1]
MLNWNTYQLLVLLELAVSLIAFLMLIPLVADPGLQLATGMIVLSLSGLTALVLRGMTGY